MIANERQYRITKAAAERLARALAQTIDEQSDVSPRLSEAMRRGPEGQLAELRTWLAEYEALRDGHVAIVQLNSLAELPDALIRARTAAGLTQRGLAERLGLKEQQIQRYEKNRYAGASLERLQQVADALGVTIREEVVFPTVADGESSAGSQPATP